MIRKTRSLLLAIALVAPSCASPVVPIAMGTWGGPSASMKLDESGGTITYLCGVGTIQEGWRVTTDDRLLATGEHHFGGGPTPAEGRPPHPATYEGIITGDRMTLTVRVTDSGTTLGPFELIRNGPPVSEACV